MTLLGSRSIERKTAILVPKGLGFERENDARLMTNPLEHGLSESKPAEASRPTSWLKVGIFAAASALAGGMAVAWYYRKTLTRLRQAEGEMLNPEFGMAEDDPDPQD